MNYPLWDVPHIGSGWVIGLIAIYHIMISHFAVGGGLYLPMAEAKALRENRRDWLDMLRNHAKFFLVITGVFGTVSGVGIWFAIGLAHPEATSALIHNFVFGWAIEWVFFMLELTAAAVYYYSWGRVSDELHLKVGWLYAIFSFLTLVIINGTDPDQVKWFAASEYDKRLDVTLLLTEGSFGAVSKRISRPLFYADRKMIERLKLKAVPSVVKQKGRLMEVTEVALPVGKTKAAARSSQDRKGTP